MAGVFKTFAVVGILILIILIKTTSPMKNIKKWNNTVIPICGDLPPICHYVEGRRETTVTSDEGYNLLSRGEWLICENAFDATMMRHFERYLNACCENKPATIDYFGINLSISIKFSSSILDKSFFVFKYRPWQRYLIIQRLRLHNLKGFDVDSYVNGSLSVVELEIYTDFNLYKNKSLVKNCREFIGNNTGDIASNKQSLWKFFFGQGSGFLGLSIFRPKPIYPICSLFFRNAKIQSFQLSYMANSMYFKNLITYSEPDNNTTPTHLLNFNVQINIMTFHQVYMIDLDSTILSPKVRLENN